MKKKPTNVPASVLARLKEIADKERLDFNFLLLRYMQERFLSRLAVSGYVNKFVLKGGFLLLAYNIEKARPTRDIDFLGINVPSDRKDLERLISEIASVDLNDGVRFLPDSVKSESIKEDADYEGVRVKLTAKIGSARNTIQIDFGFGDIVSPHPLQMDYPTLLDEESVKVLAYSKETIVTEKFEAIVKLTTFNTRMKDFYDISFLANEFDFNGESLQVAMKNTFARRQTSMNSAAELLNSPLGDEANFQHHWEAFKRRTRLTTKQDFKSVFEEIRSFLSPVSKSRARGKDDESRLEQKDQKVGAIDSMSGVRFLIGFLLTIGFLISSTSAQTSQAPSSTWDVYFPAAVQPVLSGKHWTMQNRPDDRAHRVSGWSNWQMMTSAVLQRDGLGSHG